MFHCDIYSTKTLQDRRKTIFNRVYRCLLISSCLFDLAIALPSQAQIIPDNTLGNENSIVTPNATIKDAVADLIEGGAIRENNLFHSFSEFNISNGERVYFASPEGIANILTRVTGNNISEIFGTLGILKDTASHIDGGANLFLLNPNGIVFGEHATLDVSGSFVATTADSYTFGEETQFSATDANIAPLLTVNLIPGLQMGNNPGKISINGNGHLLTGGIFFPLQNNNTTSGLQVKTGQTLGLIGGKIELNGGIIQTLGGNVELAAIEQGNVEIDFNSTRNRVKASRVTKFSDIQLINKSLIDTSGILTGNITLQGANVFLQDASVVAIQNLGIEPSGNITVKATNGIIVSDSVRNAPNIQTPQGIITGAISSRFMTETLGGGKGGDIDISGKNLTVSKSSFISPRSYSTANTGNLNLEIAESIRVNSSSILNPGIPSLIATTIFSSGSSGTINVSARNIYLSNGGTISSLNFGSGVGGDINIRVTEDLNLSGVNSLDGNPSTIGSSVYRTGNSSNVIINTGSLSLFDGARLNTGTLAEGDAGTLTINATNYIEVNGATPNGNLNSSIDSNAQIAPFALRQSLGVPDIPSGNSGNITIDTPSLIITESAFIGVDNQGLGDSGTLRINSDRIMLDNNASITAFSASGQGGNIHLQIKDWLSLNNHSAITAQTTANALDNRSNIDGGNINIRTDIVTLLENSQINADATEGNGGNINITTEGLFVSADSLISASSQFGLDGNVEVETISSDRNIELNSLPEKLVDVTQQITAGCSLMDNFTISGKGGLPNNPGQYLRSQTVWRDLRLANLQSVNIDSQNLSIAKYPQRSKILEAQTWQINKRGNVELMMKTNYIDPNNLTLSNYNC